jgi:hypothetical protein
MASSVNRKALRFTWSRSGLGTVANGFEGITPENTARFHMTFMVESTEARERADKVFFWPRITERALSSFASHTSTAEGSTASIASFPHRGRM